MPIWTGLVRPVSQLINNILDKTLKDKISDADRRALDIRAEAITAELLQKEENNFRQFILDYEGRAQDLPRGLQILRGSVRPVLTYALAGLWLYGFIDSDPGRADAMSLLFKLNVISLGFWYGERLVTRTGLLQLVKR